MRKKPEKLYAKFQRLLRGEGGQDLVEYGMLVTLIALVCISGMQSAADSVDTLFGEVSQAFDPQQQQQSPPPPPQHHHHDHGDGGDGGDGGWRH